MMTVSRAIEVLGEARELISDKSAWCTGAAAKDSNGYPIDIFAVDTACRWDASGALVRVAGLKDAIYVLAYTIDEAIRMYPQHESLRGVNDNEGHDAVLSVFDSALARLRRDDSMRKLI